MDTFSLVVGFSLAIGVGMIANTIISIILKQEGGLAAQSGVDDYMRSDSATKTNTKRKEQKKQF